MGHTQLLKQLKMPLPRPFSMRSKTSTMKSADPTENESFSDSSFVQHVANEAVGVPNSGGSLNVTAAALHHSVGAWSRVKSTKICATIKAPDMALDIERPSVDIAVALDLSLSMSGRKLRLCKQTIALLLRELRPGDRFGLVAFSSKARVVVPMRNLEIGAKGLAAAAINQLRPKAGTNLSDGIDLALKELRDVPNPNLIRTVFLLTDGMPTSGIRTAKGIVNAAQKAIDPGVAVQTFGYGSDYDEALLRDLSQITPGGSYYFVNTDANVRNAFGDALGGVLSVVAQDIVVKMAVPPKALSAGVRISEVYHKNKRVDADDGSWEVALGDLYAGESRDVVFDIELARLRSFRGKPLTHVNVSISFFDTLAKQSRESPEPISIEVRRPFGASLSPPSRHVALQWLRISSIHALNEASERGKRGDFKGGRKVLRHERDEVWKFAEQFHAAHDPLVVRLMDDLNKVLKGFADRPSYESSGRQDVSCVPLSHASQRCSDSEVQPISPYRTSLKQSIVVQFSSHDHLS